MTKKRDEQFANKKYVSMFFTQKTCLLKHTDLLVYCYRTFQAEFSEVVSHRRTAKATGLKEETVAKASNRLAEHGLLATDYSVVTPCQHMDWFHELEALREQHPDGPFWKCFRNWRSYVRKPGAQNCLQVSDVLLYSLIRNSALTGWKPQHGWSYEYLALATGMTAETASQSVGRLKKLGFVSADDGMVFRLYRLTDAQLLCFADKAQFSGTASADPDIFVDEVSPASAILDERESARADLIALLKPFPMSQSGRQYVITKTTNHAGWPDTWHEVADKAIEHVLVNVNHFD